MLRYRGTREPGATRTIASFDRQYWAAGLRRGPMAGGKTRCKSRRTWRKLHLAADAASCMIVAQTLIDQDVDDPSQVVSLRDQIEGEIAKVMADGAYDGAPTYETIAAHGDDIRSGHPAALDGGAQRRNGARAARSPCGDGDGTRSTGLAGGYWLWHAFPPIPAPGWLSRPQRDVRFCKRKQYDGRLRGSHGDRAGRSP